MLTLLFSSRDVQAFAAREATEFLSRELGVDVGIETFEYSLFSDLTIKNIFLADTDGDTLANIGLLQTDLSISSLVMENTLRFKYVTIDSIDFNLKQDSAGVTNLQFLIDYFTPEGPLPEVTIKFEFNECELSNSNFTYRKTSGPPTGMIGSFNPDSIEVRDLNLSFDIPYATQDTMALYINSFSARELSGLGVSDFGLRYFLGPRDMRVEDFELRLPNSYLNMDDIRLGYDSLAQLSKPGELAERGSFSMRINSSYISGKDFAAFVPELARLRNKLYLSTSLSYNRSSVNLNRLRLTYGRGFRLTGDASLSEPTAPRNSFIYANLSELHLSRDEINGFFRDFPEYAVEVPDMVYALGDVNFSGNLSGFVSDLVAYGRLSTAPGNIDIDVMFGYDLDDHGWDLSGKVGTEAFALGSLLSEKSLGNLAFNISMDANVPAKGAPTGKVEGLVKDFEYNGYDFEDLLITGSYDELAAAAAVAYIDKNGNGAVSADARLDFYEKQSKFTMNLDIDSLSPFGLRLTEALPEFRGSLHAAADLDIRDADNVFGDIDIDSLLIENKGESYLLDYLKIMADNSSEGQSLRIESDLINADMDGEFGFGTLANNFMHLISRQAGNLAMIRTDKIEPANDFTLNLSVAPLSQICYVMGSEFCIDDTTFVSGYFNDYRDIMELRVFANNIENNTTAIDSVMVHLHNIEHKIHLAADAKIGILEDTMRIDGDFSLADNLLGVDLKVSDGMAPFYSGELSTDLYFDAPKPGRDLNLALHIKPSLLVLGDSIWNMRESHVYYDEDKIVADDVLLESRTQFIEIDGSADRLAPDSAMNVYLKDFDLKYLSVMVNMPDITLMGKTSGYVTARNLFGTPELNADVSVESFGLNDYFMGDVEATAGYNVEKQQIDIDGILMNAENDTTGVGGYVSIANNDMLLAMDVNRVSLEFIKPYIEIFSHEFSAIASGKLYVGGEFDKITVWADAFVEGGMMGVDMLNTRFTFSDSVHMSKTDIVFDNIEITDELGNKGSVNGRLTHEYFKNFKFMIDLSVNNCRIMNTTPAHLPEFYGVIFATGGASIYGDETKTDIVVSARPNAGSYFYVPISSYSTASDDGFISYVSHEPDRNSPGISERLRQLRLQRYQQEEPPAKLNVDISVEATPDIEARIIMDSHSGDMIKGRGNGNININIDNSANVKMFGRYDVNEGEYNFSLQGAIRKTFKVGDDSYIVFNGDPMESILDVNAMYQTSASLADLLEEDLLDDAKNRITKVNCLAHIFGTLSQPQVKFGLELPNESDEMRRRVQAMVNTDEMMLQQVVFLLLMNRFYNSQLAGTSGTGNNSVNSMALSLATATISSQLNYWMSQISQNVNLGVSYREEEDIETNRQFEVNISTNLFNNRLLIDGNLGYRYQYGYNDFIGDFNIEYLLTPSGRIRLKAYNQTNDKLYYSSLYTQGLGIMYREDFDTWANLAAFYRSLTVKKTPEEKAAAKEAKAKRKEERKKKRENDRLLREDRMLRHEQYVAEQKALRKAEKEKKKAGIKEEPAPERPTQVFIAP